MQYTSKIMMLFAAAVAFFAVMCQADNHYDSRVVQPMSEKDKVIASLNLTTGGPYTYSQSGHHFYGTGYDGSWIDDYGCCSGQSGSCRNNPSCQCEVSVGPLPQGGYTLGNMREFKGMQYCYDLYPDSSNNMCGRSGFLIHGGGCSGNPSEGCIVIEDQNVRYKIKSGARLTVVK